MLELKDLRLARGATILIDNANARLHPGQRIGLTGKNGSGKSSLFAALRGELDIDRGELTYPDNWLIASVKQETPSSPASALDYVLDGHSAYRAACQALAEAETDGDGMALARAHDQYSAVNGYAQPARAAELLSGLGFAPEEHAKPVSSFSGGWRMRLNLAQALIAPADLLLLDEPTNHLDLDAIIWLQDFLKSHPASQLIIAHDREFLDGLCQHIWHIEHGELSAWRGNYSAFERLRHEKRLQQDAEYAKSERQRAHLQSFVDRFRAKASKAKQAQSRLKALAKLDAAPPPPPEHSYRLAFAEPEYLPEPALTLNKAATGYDGKAVVSHIRLTLSPGTRIGLLGHNGAGKSTVMKLLAGELPLLAGEQNIHPYAKTGYFTQHQLDALIPADSPLDHLARLWPHKTTQDMRNYLGGYGFGGERAEQPVAPFSGGEKTRLALALVIARHPNILLLDEPTNHLDLPMRDALTTALQQYSGALVVISHDRHLLAATCNEYYHVSGGRITPFDGDLDDYRLLLRAEKPAPDAQAPKGNSAAARQEQKRLEAERRQSLQPLKKELQTLEKQMEKLQAEQTGIETSLADPALYEDSRKADLTALIEKQGKNRTALLEAESRWLQLMETIETAENEK